MQPHNLGNLLCWMLLSAAHMRFECHLINARLRLRRPKSMHCTHTEPSHIIKHWLDFSTFHNSKACISQLSFVRRFYKLWITTILWPKTSTVCVFDWAHVMVKMILRLLQEKRAVHKWIETAFSVALANWLRRLYLALSIEHDWNTVCERSSSRRVYGQKLFTDAMMHAA